VRQAYDGFSKDTTPDAPAASGEIPVGEEGEP
jgi:hypothetical protein